jgi:hypothetical protein
MLTDFVRRARPLFPCIPLRPSPKAAHLGPRPDLIDLTPSLNPALVFQGSPWAERTVAVAGCER